MGRSKKTVYKCKHCPKEFKCSTDLDKHIKCHAMPKVFRCASCDSSFHSSILLKSHITDVHLKVEPLDCTHCGVSFADEASFKSHLDTHLSENIFRCDKCEKSFKRLSNLKCHERAHFGKKKKLRVSKIREKQLSTLVEKDKRANLMARSNLSSNMKHVKKNSPETKNLYPCSMCTETFSVCSELRKHEAMHTCKNKDLIHYLSKIVKSHSSKVDSNSVSKKFNCASCDTSFNTAAMLKNHITRLHLKLELFDCSHCGESFTDEGSYKNHMTTHKPAMQFNCDKCDKSFSFLRSLKCHERAHFGKRKKPLLCKICKKCFSTSVDLFEHKFMHSIIKADNNSKVKKLKSPKQRFRTVPEEMEPTSQNVDIHNYLLKTVETSDGVDACNWCYLCDVDLDSAEDLKLHFLKEHNTVNDLKETHKTILQSYKSMNEKEKKSIRSFSKRGRKCTIQKKKVKNPKKPKKPNTVTKAPHTGLNLNHVNTTEQTIQDPATGTMGNPFVITQPQQIEPRIMFNIAQPPYDLLNTATTPNFQLLTVPTEVLSQNNSDIVPKFDFDSEDYISWLKAFINKCKSQNYPLPPALAKNISQVNDDIVNALIVPEGSLKRREVHFHLLQFHQTISEIMMGHVKYYLAPQHASNVNI